MEKLALYWTRFWAVPHALKVAGCIALLCLALPVFADSIARQGSDWVRLTLKPCEDAQVVAVMQAQGLKPEDFRAGLGHFGGQDFAACWRPAGGGAALVYGDGDQGYVPVGDLKIAPEA